jgi:hypothetical protein
LFYKNRVENILHYLKKLEDQINHEAMISGDDESEYATTPLVPSAYPSRVRR